MSRAAGWAALLAVLWAGSSVWAWRATVAAGDRERRLEAAIAARDSAGRAWDAERAGLLADMGRLREDSAQLEARRRAARAWSQDSIRKLLALIPDSAARAAAEGAVALEAGETARCEEQRANCEARAANAEARAAGDSTDLAALRLFVRDTLEVSWRDAERRARPSLLRDLWRSRGLTGPLVVVAFAAGFALGR